MYQAQTASGSAIKKLCKSKVFVALPIPTTFEKVDQTLFINVTSAFRIEPISIRQQLSN